MRSLSILTALVLFLSLSVFAQSGNLTAEDPNFDTTFDTADNGSLPHPPATDNIGQKPYSPQLDSLFGPLHPPVEVINFQDNPYNHNMGIASDGQYYYTVNGGQLANGMINVYDMQGNFISTNPIQLDMRGIVYNHNDGFLYVSTYTNTAVYKILSVGSGTFQLLHSNILMNSQSSIGISWDGLKFYDHNNGTVNVHDFYSGAIIQTLTGFSYGPGNYGGCCAITADPDYLYTWNADTRVLYVYEMDATFVLSYNLPNGDNGMSLGFIDGNIFVSVDANYGIGTWYGYNIRDMVPQDFSVTLTPYSTPIQIPANGGTFSFNVAVTNNETSSATCQAWTMATLPNGSEYGPIIGPLNLTLGGGVSVDRDRVQAVPAAAPAGDYTYDAYVGYYPATIWDEDHFDFEKLSVSDGGAYISDWLSWGAELDGEECGESLITPTDYITVSAYPNPFNPTTTIHYELQNTGNVSLVIYDIAGREMARLVNGLMPAGAHRVVFDGSELASGVYLVRLEAGDSQQTQKIILLR